MRPLISFPLLVFTTAALTAGVHTGAPAQERIGPLIINAPHYDAEPAGPPDFTPGTRVAVRERNNFGGGLFEFLATGRTGNRDATLTRQPSDRQWQDAAPEYDRAPDRLYGPYRLGRRDAPDVRETPARPAFDPRFAKQTVNYITDEKPGTVVVDTRARFLYLVQENGKAIRYGIGVGRIGFTWSGIKTVSQKREWPDWRPPPEMLKRRPDLPTWMAGGIDNPLGARAIYLGSTLYRIHGSNEPWTIGQAVSSGCFRMRNDDVMELYDKVKIGTKVVVI